MNPPLKYISAFFIAAIILVSTPGISYAQVNPVPAAGNPLNLSFELGGNAVAYSVNLEGGITRKKPLLQLRVGIEFLPIRIKDALEYRSIGILGELSSLFGKSRNKFEAGLGLSYIYLYDDLQSNIFGDSADLFLLVPRLGYRFYSKNGRRYFKLAYTPLLVLDENDGDDWGQAVIPFYMGISYGFQLGKRKHD